MEEYLHGDTREREVNSLHFVFWLNVMFQNF